MKARKRGAEASDVSVSSGVCKLVVREAMACEADADDGRRRSAGRVMLETVYDTPCDLLEIVLGVSRGPVRH